MMANLLDNAIKFSPEDETGAVKLFQQGETPWYSRGRIEAVAWIRPSPLTEKEKLTHLRTLDRSVTRTGLLTALITVLIGTGVHTAEMVIAQREIFSCRVRY